MTGIVRWNKTISKAGADGWNLTTDDGTALDSANVIVPVANATERDGLTPPLGKYAGMAVARTDLAGIPLQVWDGAAWISSVKTDVGQGGNVPMLESSTAPVTVTTNSLGYSTVFYPTAFPTATSSFMVMEADDTMGAITLKSISSTPTSFNFKAFASTGGAIVSTPIKVTWIATGY